MRFHREILDWIMRNNLISCRKINLEDWKRISGTLYTRFILIYIISCQIVCVLILCVNLGLIHIFFPLRFKKQFIFANNSTERVYLFFCSLVN